LEELIRLNDARPGLSIPHPLLRPILSRVEPGRIVELLQRRDLKSEFIHDLAHALPEKKKREIGPALLDLVLQGKPVFLCNRLRSIFVEDESMLQKIVLSAPRLSSPPALDLIYGKPGNPCAGIALAGRLLGHREKSVRDRSFSFLQRNLGDPRTWLPASMAGTGSADSCLETVVSLRMAVFLHGITAVEKALKSPDPAVRGAARILLARAGLDLSPLAALSGK